MGLKRLTYHAQSWELTTEVDGWEHLFQVHKHNDVDTGIEPVYRGAHQTYLGRPYWYMRLL